jgi:acyl-CoA synthetase (AMP-forming)/AMP-acid ligase II
VALLLAKEGPPEDRCRRRTGTGKGVTVPTITARPRISGSANLYRLVADAGRMWPDRVAVGTADRRLQLSYRDLDIAVQDLAGLLERLGIGPGDTVALCCGNSVEFVLTLLAAASIGVAVAPLDPGLSRSGLAGRATAVHARAVIVAENENLYAGPAAGQQAAPCPVWRVSMSGQGARAVITVPPGCPELPAPGAGAVPRDVALLLSTAGSTSAPKVVPLTAGNVAASVSGICGTYRLGPQDATLLVMPLYHGHGLIAGLLASLASGGAVYVPRAGRFSASTFWAEMVSAGATWYTAVPTIHQILLQRAAAEYPRGNPPPLRFIRSCSAPLAPAVFHQLESAFSAPVLPAYGLTESCHQAASNPLPEVGPVKAGSVGLPTGPDLRITGPDGEAAQPGTPGEVRIRGAAVAAGYLDDPGTSAATFVDGWLRTGDLGYQDPDGYLFLTGRIKEMINRGGEKFSPQQIDAVLLSSPKVLDALSFGVPDEKYGEEVNAAVILKPGQHAGEQELKTYCRSNLGEAGTPKRIYFASEFPRTPKNAGDRRKLAAQFTSSRGN